MPTNEEMLASLEKRQGELDKILATLTKKSKDEFPFDDEEDKEEYEDDDEAKAKKRRVRLKKNGEFEDPRDGQIVQLNKTVEDLVKALDDSSNLLDGAAKAIVKLQEDHAADLKKAKEGTPAPTEDEIKKGEALTIEGQVIRKADVGDVQFAVLKGQAEKIAKAEAEIAKERDLRETAELKKKADEAYPAVPGSVDERAAMLKAIGGMDETLQKSFTAVFEQSQKLAKAAFNTLGHRGGGAEDIAKSAADFNAKVAEIKKRDECSNTEAMQKATREFPDLFKAYQGTQPQ
jgi:hypothetical protein